MSEPTFKTIQLNGFDIIDDLITGHPPERKDVYCEDIRSKDWCVTYPWLFTRKKNAKSRRDLARMSLHYTREGAVAACKARYGIDPEGEEP